MFSNNVNVTGIETFPRGEEPSSRELRCVGGIWTIYGLGPKRNLAVAYNNIVDASGAMRMENPLAPMQAGRFCDIGNGLGLEVYQYVDGYWSMVVRPHSGNAMVPFPDMGNPEQLEVRHVDKSKLGIIFDGWRRGGLEADCLFDYIVFPDQSEGPSHVGK